MAQTEPEKKFYLQDYAGEDTTGPFDYEEIKHWVISEGWKTTFEIYQLKGGSFIECTKVFETNRDYLSARQKYLKENALS